MATRTATARSTLQLLLLLAETYVEVQQCLYHMRGSYGIAPQLVDAVWMVKLSRGANTFPLCDSCLQDLLEKCIPEDLTPVVNQRHIIG